MKPTSTNSAPGAPALPRVLSARERSVLDAMIEHAVQGEPWSNPTAEGRARWRSLAGSLVVDDVCGCEMCPSVSLALPQSRHAEGAEPSAATVSNDDYEERTVLTAELPDALVLLFIDGDVPTYLELAPLDDETKYLEFPEVGALRF